MPRFRLFLVWLLMAALPLQGWAAASMLYCGPAQREAAHAQANAPAHDSHHVMHEQMHSAHHGVDSDDHAQFDTGALPPQDTGATDGASHTCGVCAACCHGLALAPTQHWDGLLPAPHANLAQPVALVLAGGSSVPDKPPRV